MGDRRLRAEIEERVRQRIELGLDFVEKPRLTEEQKQARLELMTRAQRKLIEDHGWPDSSPVSDESKEAYIASEVESILELVVSAREKSGKSGPLTDSEMDNTLRSRPHFAADYMLFRLRAQPAHPLRSESIDWLEQSKRDLEILRNSPTEEQVAEIQKRVEAELSEVNPEGWFRKAKELLEDEEASDK
jgi:hypothetical protein